MITDVDFVALPTQDYEKAAEFYGETLGLPFRKRWGEMPAGEFQAGNTTIALMQMDAFGQEFKPHGSPLAFHVEDFDSAKAKLESKGIQFQMDVIDSGVCKMVFFNDPDGNTVGIHHRYAPGG
jgi:predicted enzyme related to lactoylglutathione lyase